MSHAIIGMFNSTAAAAQAQSQLLSIGIPAGDIRLSSSGDAGSTAGAVAEPHQSRGFWDSVKEMFGADESSDEHLGVYAEGERRGGAVLRVDAEESQADRVVEVLQSAGAVDVDAMASSWRNSGWTGNNTTTASTTTTTASTQPAATDLVDTYDTGAATVGVTPGATADKAAGFAAPDVTASAPGTASGSTSSNVAATDAAGKIDLVKEDLQVGKRVVNRGGIRIIKKVIERPVEESVNLREEHVSVDRRAVNRPLQGADANDAFKDQTIELTENAEQIVAAKTARVIGEVVVGKTATERTEKVTDTLRETDVDVQRLPGETTSSTSKSVEDSGPVGTTRSSKTGV